MPLCQYFCRCPCCLSLPFFHISSAFANICFCFNSRHLVEFLKRLNLAALHIFRPTLQWPCPPQATTVTGRSRSPTTPSCYTNRRVKKFSPSRKCKAKVFNTKDKKIKPDLRMKVFHIQPAMIAVCAALNLCFSGVQFRSLLANIFFPI